MLQYVRDKYERKIFMNQSPAVGPSAQTMPTLSAPFPVSKSGPTLKEVLENLKAYGFSDTKACLDAYRLRGPNIDDIVEYLVNGDAKGEIQEDSAKKRSHVEADHLETQHSEPRAEESTASTFYNSSLYEPNPWATLPQDETSYSYEDEEVFATNSSKKPTTRASAVDQQNPFKRSN
jgi:hypothetical protein